MSRWGMVIDLKGCVTCYSCVLACKQEHFLPPNISWNRLLVGEVGEYPDAKKVTYPVLCAHCEDAECVRVCPTGASHKRADGIVAIDADKCTGCQHCVISCPYHVRVYFEGDSREHFPGQGLTPLEVMGTQLHPHQEGTVSKCNFCMDRVDTGLALGLKPGVDHDATPACCNTCMCKARHFGDLDDPESNVSRLIRERNGYRLHPEFGTSASVYYID